MMRKVASGFADITFDIIGSAVTLGLLVTALPLVVAIDHQTRENIIRSCDRNRQLGDLYERYLRVKHNLTTTKDDLQVFLEWLFLGKNT